MGNGFGVVDAVKAGGDYVAGAIAAAYPVGGGAGPVNHGFQLMARPLALGSSQPFTDFLLTHDPEIWTRFVRHPFTTGMASGKLPLASFLHYIRQDYHYLKVTPAHAPTPVPALSS